MSAAPPRLAQWLLRRLLPPDRYETVAGDFEEIFQLEQLPRLGARAARRWFWRQVLSIAWTRILRQAARPLLPAALLAAPRRGDRMQAIRHDLRYAIRALLKTPGFTVIAVLTLALGIGGSTAIFTLVQGLLLKPLPFKDPGQLMMVHISVPESEVRRGGPRELPWSYPKYQQLFKASQQAFEESALFQGVGWNLTSRGGDPEALRGEWIDSHYLSVLGVTPQLGRDIRPDEDRAPGVAPIVLIAHALWEGRFGGDPEVLGRAIGLNGIPHTIVGILPAGFRGLTGEAQLFVPIMSSSNAGLAQLHAAWAHPYYLVARRKAGVSIAQAQSETAAIGARLDAAFPPPPFVAAKGGFGAYAIPLEDSRTDPLMRRAVFVLLGAVGAVLLIGCVNLANLMLTRGLARRREVAIRLAIGATRGRVVRQFLTESLIVAAAGAVAGLLVAVGAMKLAVWLLPEMNIILPRDSFVVTRIGLGMIGLDLTTVLFTLALAAVTALLFGLAPAWRASRADVAHTLKSGGAGSVGRGGAGVASLRNLLVVAQSALALVLLVAAGLMLTSVRNLQATGLGFQPDGLILSWVSLPAARYDAPHVLPFVTRLLDELRAQPGVQAAAFGTCAPVSGGCSNTPAIRPERPFVPGTAPQAGVLPVSPEYFQTLGIRLIKGRTFSDRDRDGQPRVAVINETAARRLWPGEDPIGKRVRLAQIYDGDGAEVVGVVADVRYHPVEASMTPDVYISFLQAQLPNGFMFIRTRGDVAETTATIRSVLRRLDAELPVVNVKTMGNRFGEATWRTRLSADLLTLFAALALLLAAIGLYGVMAQGVEQRTREIGVRMALGANRANIFRLVISRALIIGTIGTALGVCVSMLSTPFLDTLLYQVNANDPLTIAVLAITLIAVTLLASYIPARRATRIDPLTSLRAE
jgi:putative ABC transport system permease protein